MKRNLVLIFLTLAVLGSNAQQDPQFTQWMFDKVSFNPAAAGIDEAHCLTMFFREQWAGVATLVIGKLCNASDGVKWTPDLSSTVNSI